MSIFICLTSKGPITNHNLESISKNLYIDTTNLTYSEVLTKIYNVSRGFKYIVVIDLDKLIIKNIDYCKLIEVLPEDFDILQLTTDNCTHITNLFEFHNNDIYIRKDHQYNGNHAFLCTKIYFENVEELITNKSFVELPYTRYSNIMTIPIFNVKNDKKTNKLINHIMSVYQKHLNYYL
jgi:hypothetical protein